MPLNNDCLELLTAVALPSLATLAGATRLDSLRVTVDVAVTGATDTSKTALLVGTAASWTMNLGVLASPNTDGSFATGFVTVRNAVTKTATIATTSGGLVLGRRTIFHGVDDRSTVSIYEDGTAGSVTASWTAAQVSPYAITASVPVYVLQKADQTNALLGRLYSVAIEANDVLIAHWRPKRTHTGLGKVPDLSGYGNDLVLSGAEGTDYAFRAAWSREVAYSGKETLA